tara:strand:+ start:41 stop:196 length:156 start_codon:yes stop_codon:yes gene_type:complete
MNVNKSYIVIIVLLVILLILHLYLIGTIKKGAEDVQSTISTSIPQWLLNLG